VDADALDAVRMPDESSIAVIGAFVPILRRLMELKILSISIVHLLENPSANITNFDLLKIWECSSQIWTIF
jgi:hypothetical protein